MEIAIVVHFCYTETTFRSLENILYFHNPRLSAQNIRLGEVNTTSFELKWDQTFQADQAGIWEHLIEKYDRSSRAWKHYKILPYRSTCSIWIERDSHKSIRLRLCLVAANNKHYRSSKSLELAIDFGKKIFDFPGIAVYVFTTSPSLDVKYSSMLIQYSK